MPDRQVRDIVSAKVKSERRDFFFFQVNLPGTHLSWEEKSISDSACFLNSWSCFCDEPLGSTQMCRIACCFIFSSSQFLLYTSCLLSQQGNISQPWTPLLCSTHLFNKSLLRASVPCTVSNDSFWWYIRKEHTQFPISQKLAYENQERLDREWLN